MKTANIRLLALPLAVISSHPPNRLLLISQLKERKNFSCTREREDDESDEGKEGKARSEEKKSEKEVDCIFERFRRLWALRALRNHSILTSEQICDLLENFYSSNFELIFN